MFVRKHEGVFFREFVVHMVSMKRARTYLEIGVRDGGTISQVTCDAIGVDPNFQLSFNPIPNKRALHLFRETSDEFFRNRDVLAIAGNPIDVAFLDGLHQFEYLLRDFINTENVCHRDSLIMLDDCLPVNVEMTEREYRPEIRKERTMAQWWTGDVWKIIPVLKKYRKDLRLTLVDTSPTGNVCITNLNPNSAVLKDNYYKILDEYFRLELDDAMLSRFYEENIITSSNTVMNGFDASLFAGP